MNEQRSRVEKAEWELGEHKNWLEEKANRSEIVFEKRATRG